jgi:Holliday junction resolvase
MSKSERVKGADAEREVAAIYREHGFSCDRTPQSGGLRWKGDLVGSMGEHVEVKRQEIVRPWLWIAQAENESVGPWAIAFRRNRTKWYALTELERHVALVAAALSNTEVSR